MTSKLPALGNAAPRLWNDFVPNFCWDQDFSAPVWVTGKCEQIFSRRTVRVAGRISMTSHRFYGTWFIDWLIDWLIDLILTG